VTIACEAGHVFSTCHGALGCDLELQDLCMMTWVPMSHLLASIRPETPSPWSLSVDEQPMAPRALHQLTCDPQDIPPCVMKYFRVVKNNIVFDRP
jgi:hypothetical protein